jgi:riboflavin biosynthesis pyrimidine reductase
MTIAPGDLEVLFEKAALLRFDLPGALASLYGGGIGFRRPCLLANFVASVDGVVAVAGPGESGHVISGDSEADAFVMALLRTCADAVMVGAGTFRKASGHLWQGAEMYPAGAALLEEARNRLGLRPRPAFVLVTGGGDVDTTQAALRDALILTTAEGAEKLHGRAPPGAEVLAWLGKSVPATWVEAMERLHARGLSVVLSEGGPSLLAELAAARVLDELFVTSSPVLWGRFPHDLRKSLADGMDLAGLSLELLSARRHRSHLFLRYAVSRGDA